MTWIVTFVHWYPKPRNPSEIRVSSNTVSWIIRPARWVPSQKVRGPINLVFFWVSKNTNVCQLQVSNQKTQQIFGGRHHGKNQASYRTYPTAWLMPRSISKKNRAAKRSSDEAMQSLLVALDVFGPSSVWKKSWKIEDHNPQTMAVSPNSCWILIRLVGGSIYFNKLHRIWNDDPSWLHHHGINLAPHLLVKFPVRLLHMVKVKEGEECPPSRCEMPQMDGSNLALDPPRYTCRLYNMHDWLQPWSVITYEVGWHPNLTIGGHTVHQTHRQGTRIRFRKWGPNWYTTLLGSKLARWCGQIQQEIDKSQGALGWN